MRTPHDTLFHHACALAWVISVLPGLLSQWIDWSGFQPANGHVSGLRLRSHHADLVFTARLLGGEHKVLFVIEHKSSREEGKEIGKALGESTAKAQTLLRQLRRRFRDDSEPFAERVLAATVPELDRILDAESAAAVFAD